jgi:hypothetical protein
VCTMDVRIASSRIDLTSKTQRQSRH